MPLDPQHVIRLGDKEYATYQGILALAHEKGLKAIETELIQAPTQANEQTAIVRATVILEGGQSFSDYGDASPRNCSTRVATALIRMASTRSKGRALRDAVNVGVALLEELSEQEVAANAPPANGKARAREAVQAAETSTVADQVNTPAPPPGFEPWCEIENKRLQRIALINTFRTDWSVAEEWGLEGLTPIVPEELPNEALYRYGKELRARIKAEKARREAAKGKAA